MDNAETLARPADAVGGAAPWHLWAVGLVTLLWNCYGAYEYLMEMTRNTAYMAEAGAGLDEVLDGLPAWVTAGWAVAVWASLAGSVLLLLRSRHAQLAYLVALVGAVTSFGYQLVGESDLAVWIMPVVITLVIAAQWYYAQRQTAAGVLR